MADAGALLDRRKVPPRVDLAASIYRARKAGRPFLGQIADWFRLRRTPNRLTPIEYYTFRLYRSGLTDAARRTFLGERGQTALYRRRTDPTWAAAAHDKLLYYAVMRGLGFRIPRVLAVHHATRRFADAEALPDPATVARFLRQTAYPLFGKPVTGKYSVGTVALVGVDMTADRLRASSGAEASVDAFVAELQPFAGDGYLFQERLAAHPFVRAACGDRIATVRVVVVLAPEGPVIHRTLWKIPTGAHVADNFWRSGNLLGAIDPASGRLTRVVRGVGPGQETVECHPDTGFRLVGAVIPDWDAVTALILRAAPSFPGVRVQAWDVALTDEGPLLLELNVGGDVNLPQHALDAGVYDGALAALDRDG